MKPEVVVILVANLLSLRSLVLPASSAAPTGNEHGRATNGIIQLPVGDRFDARRKRSLPVDSEEAGSNMRRRPMSGDEFIVKPNIADVGHRKRFAPGHVTRRDWGQGEMQWLRRRSPAGSRVLRPYGTWRKRGRKCGGQNKETETRRQHRKTQDENDEHEAG